MGEYRPFLGRRSVRTLVQLIIRLRWVLLAALFAITATGTYLVLTGLTFDFSPRALFLTHDEEIDYLDAFRQRFGAEDANFLVVVHADGDELWTPEGLALVDSLTTQLEELDKIGDVISLTNVWIPKRSDWGGLAYEPLMDGIPDDPEAIAAAREIALSNKLLADRLVNEDGDTAVIVATFIEDFEGEKRRRPTLDAADEIVASTVHEPFEAYAFGFPQAQREYALLLPRDLVRNSAVSVILISVFLWLLFRNKSAIVVANTAVGFAMVWTLAAMVIADHPIDLVNSVITSLVLVIGVSESVHLIARYRELLASGRPPDEALRVGVSRVALACLLTAVTSAVGFASLATASINVVQALGIFAALGIMFAYVTSIILVPACYSFLPPPKGEAPGIANRSATGRWTDWVGRYVTTARGRRQVWIISLIVTGLSIAGCFLLDANNHLLEEMWPRNRTRVANEFVEEHFGGVLNIEIQVVAAAEGGVVEPEVLAGMLELQEWLDEDPYVRRGLSLADLVTEAHQLATGEEGLPDSSAQVAQELFLFELGGGDNPVDQFVDAERRHARISTSMRDWGSDHFFDWQQRFYAKTEECFPDGTEVRLTGAILVANKALTHIVGDTFRSLATAFVVISILMTLLFRSVKIGLLSMIPNLLPLLVTLGFMGFTGITIRTSTVLIFALSLGVAVDDTIHILSRYRQELEVDGDLQAALRRSVSTTGQAIVYASTLLVMGFAIFLTSSFFGLFQFGFLGAITLTTALLADLFLTPVFIQTFNLRVKGVGERQRRGDGDS